MSTAFLISDTHFSHANILKFEAEARPFSSVEEMNEKLIENWNSVVGHNDTIWHLGDVLFGNKNFPLLDRLNGRKNLVLGNHDHYGKGVASYMEKFRDVRASKKFDDYLLTHVPIHPSQFYRFAGNVHGHLHSSLIMETVEAETGIGTFHCEVPDKRYVNVSCEQTNLTPIAWEEVKERFNAT